MHENQTLIWAMNILKREMKNDLYGSVTFKFEKGNIACVKTEKTEKPVFVD